MQKITNALEIIKRLGGDTATGMCSCPVAGHGEGRGDKRPSLWVSPEGTGIKCHARCDRKAVVAALKAIGVAPRYKDKPSSLTKPKVPSVNADFDEAQRFLDLVDPDAEAWTFQTFDDAGKNRTRPTILHSTLKECAAELKKKSRYGSGVFVCLQRTDLKGRKAENIVGIRVVSVDLDGAPLEPVRQGELKPHAIVESSPGRYWAHWAVKDLPLAEFGGSEQLGTTARHCRPVRRRLFSPQGCAEGQW